MGFLCLYVQLISYFCILNKNVKKIKANKSKIKKKRVKKILEILTLVFFLLIN